jgi:GH15 family glucan-1,4-alpha-glucosidase
MTGTPIADYALLSNCQGSALVSRNGSIDWACLPRFDRPSIFARLLGSGAGHWRIGPTFAASSERAYLPDTMVLRTVFRATTGSAALYDALAVSPDERGHHIGRHAPPVIVRMVEGLDGEVDLDIELAIRTGYGLTTPEPAAGTPWLNSRSRVRAGECRRSQPFMLALLSASSWLTAVTRSGGCSPPRRRRSRWQRGSGCGSGSSA